MRSLAAVTLISLALGASVGVAHADRAVAFHTVVDDDGTRRIVIDTPIDVAVRAPAPAVAILHPAPRIEYAWPASVDSFVPAILASVRARVFGGAVEAQP